MKRALFRTFFSAAAFMCLLASANTSIAMTNSPIMTFRDGSEPGKLNGYWRSRGYGWLLEIKNGKVYFYNESTRHCIRDDEETEDLKELAQHHQISDDGRAMRMPLGDDTYFFTFDRLNRLPDSCHEKLDTTPKSVLDSFIEIFSTHYAFFNTRNINWPAMADSATKRAEANMSSTELLDVIKGIISEIDDDHVSIEAKIEDQKVVLNSRPGKTVGALTALAERKGKNAEKFVDDWLARVWNKDIGKALLRGKGRETANGSIRYGIVDGDIGYIAIQSMIGLANDDNVEDEDIKVTNKALDKALALFKGSRAVIVDVTLNDGGFDKVARTIAGRFAAQRTLGYYKYAGDSEADEPQAIYIEPTGKNRFTGPVYMITSDITVSAAEIFTMSMRALPNVTHVGDTTRGSLSDMLWKPLPNGWNLSLSNEVYLDARRKSWEGAGIPPQVPMDVFSTSDITAGPLKAIEAVIKLALDKQLAPVAQLQ